MAIDFTSLLREERAKERAKRHPKLKPSGPSETDAPITPLVRPRWALRLAEVSPQLRSQRDRPKPELVGAEILLDVRYANDFISKDEEASLMYALEPDDGSWVRARGRMLLRFGGAAGSTDFVPEPLPPCIHEVANAASHAVGETLNHCLVNSYDPGEGIMKHTDGPAYEHVTATISCGQDRLVYFAKRLQPSEVGTAVDAGPVMSVLLRRRSLLVFKGDAYIEYTHSIEPTRIEVVDARAPCANACMAHVRKGDCICVTSRRLSFTLRKARTGL